MAWDTTALGLASHLGGAWASAGTAGTWAGVADGTIRIMLAHGAGVDIRTTVAPTGVHIHTIAGDMVVITADTLATASTKTAAIWLPEIRLTAVPIPVQPVCVARRTDEPFPELPPVAMR